MKNPAASPLIARSFTMLLAGLFLVVWQQNTSAANYTWNATGTANWSVGPWTGGTPSSNQDNALFFNVTTATRSAVNDLGAFDLNSLSLSNTSTGTTQRNLGVSGNALNFVTNSSSALPTLTINNSSTTTTPGVGTLALSNDFTVTNALTITNSGSALSTISGNITNTGGITINGGGVGNLSFSTARVISGNGSVAFNASGSFLTSFGGTNTYTGGTTITSGTVQAQSNSAFGTGSLAVNGGTLDLYNRTVAVGALSGSSSSAVITSTHASSAAGITSNSSTDSTYAGSINKKASGTGTVSLIKQGTGTLTLSGTNTYDGSSTISGGTLQYAKQASLYNATTASWTKTNIIVSNGATLALNVGDSASGYFDATALNTLQTNLLGSNAAAQGFQAGSFIALDTTNATGGTFTQGNAITNSSGAGGGAVGLKKLGTGTLVLDKTNTYTGPTNVTAGTLVLNGSTTSAMNVSSGAVLGGSGTINSTANITGSLRPGNSIGTINANTTTWVGAASAGADTDWVFELGAGNTADLLNITGDFTKDDSLGTVFRFDLAGSTELGTFKLVDWSGTTTFVATDFAYTNLGAGNTGTFAFNGSQLELTIVPEPATWTLLALGLTTAVVFRRRRMV